MNSIETQGHYKTAGTGLIIVGLINSGVALYSLVLGSSNPFIDYETMLTFAILFIAVGTWMRNFTINS